MMRDHGGHAPRDKARCRGPASSNLRYISPPLSPCYPVGMAQALRATVKAGHLVIDKPIDPPEGTVVDLIPVSQTPHPRPKFGSARGRVHMAPDFDAPLDDFADYVR